MATLYQKRGYWYLSASYNGRRIARSLKTKSRKTVQKLLPFAETELLLEITGIKAKKQNLGFPQLVKIYLSLNHNWQKSTLALKKHILSRHAKGYPLPDNPNTKAIHTAHINACWNWGLKNGYVKTAKKLHGNTKGVPRTRVFSQSELELLFNNVSDQEFGDFIKFAYYTGARSGEIRQISKESIKDDYILVNGKTGRRTVKLNSQAKEIMNRQDSPWSYSKGFVSHKFKKEVRKIGIKNARFHDLRRSFGLNLIKQGISIYKVSKLLGHSSVTTTERHYAPLLTTEIEDFVL
ncbi:MAG TPA: site-specific integrase [Flavobacteriales bacterium]|nr:site-specific integrase [Flavobacteriales bacterium]